jgi:hypothetical protein
MSLTVIAFAISLAVITIAMSLAVIAMIASSPAVIASEAWQSKRP